MSLALAPTTEPTASYRSVNTDISPSALVARVRLAVIAVAMVALPIVKPASVGHSGPVDLFVAASIVAAVIVAGSRLRLPYGLSVIVSAAAGAVAGLVSSSVGARITMTTIAQDLWLLAFAGAIATVARDRAAIATLLRAWCAGAVCWAALLWFGVFSGTSWLSGLRASEGSRAALTFGDPNYAANYFLISLLLVVATGWPVRPIARIGVEVLLAGCVLFTGSNGALVTLVVALAVLAVRGAAMRWGAVAALTVTLCIAGAGTWQVAACTAGSTSSGGPTHLCLADPVQLSRWAASTHQRLLTDSLGRATQSTGQRGELLHETLGLRDGAASLLGIGPAATKTELLAHGVPFAKEAHNDFVASLVERGIIGAFALIALVGSVAIRLREGLRFSAAADRSSNEFPAPRRLVARGPAPPRHKPLIRRPEALVLAVFSIAAAGWFYEVLHFRHVWALLGLVAAMGFQAER